MSLIFDLLSLIFYLFLKFFFGAVKAGGDVIALDTDCVGYLLVEVLDEPHHYDFLLDTAESRDTFIQFLNGLLLFQRFVRNEDDLVD